MSEDTANPVRRAARAQHLELPGNAPSRLRRGRSSVGQ